MTTPQKTFLKFLFLGPALYIVNILLRALLRQLIPSYAWIMYAFGLIFLALPIIIIIQDFKSKTFNRTLGYLSGVFVLPIIFSFILMFSFEANSDYDKSIPFNSDAWKTESIQSTKNPVRQYMINDLLYHRGLKGLSKAEIDDLLGPAPAEYFYGYDYVYYLGPERNPFLSIDSEWLVIKFQSEIVTEAKVMTD